MNVHIYRIKCLTDLHVGSGEINFSIIDQEVEKDPVTKEATIFSSGLKGALREHFLQNGMGNDTLNTVFGYEGKDETNQRVTSPGTYKFLGADLICRPLRVSSGAISSINVTTPELLRNFRNKMIRLGMTDTPQNILARDEDETVGDGKFLSTINSIDIEGCRVERTIAAGGLAQKLIGDNYAVTASLRDYDLPVLARNVLADKKSKNLWYEELVPHDSIFCFAVLVPDGEPGLTFKENVPVQIGGNSSIGQGFTSIDEITFGG